MNTTWIHVKAGWKLFLFFLVLVLSILALYLRLLVTPREKKQHIKFSGRQRFCKKAHSIFGVHLVVVGEHPPVGSYLYVSNHRSFYDPVAFLSQLIANPVSKAEVGRYPFIGWGTKLTEVLMLDRFEKKERNKMKHQIFENLQHGTSILIYPEGTTSSARYTDSFRKGAFEAAFKAGCKIIPIAMEYPDSSYYWTNRSMYQHFIYQLIKRNDNRIFMAIGAPVSGLNTMDLLHKTKITIDGMIEELRQLRMEK